VLARQRQISLFEHHVVAVELGVVVEGAGKPASGRIGA
jgi:hypothetical protein